MSIEAYPLQWPAGPNENGESMIDREDVAARLFVELYRVSGEGADIGQIAAEAIAASQSFAAAACAALGHIHLHEGPLHEHECQRCGGNIAGLVRAMVDGMSLRLMNREDALYTDDAARLSNVARKLEEVAADLEALTSR